MIHILNLILYRSYMSDPTRLQLLLATLKGDIESEYVGVTRQVPFRIRSDLFARLSAVHALANMKKKTPRNNILNDLLEIALDQVELEADNHTASEIKRFSFDFFLQIEAEEKEHQAYLQEQKEEKEDLKR